MTDNELEDDLERQEDEEEPAEEPVATQSLTSEPQHPIEPEKDKKQEATTEEQPERLGTPEKEHPEEEPAEEPEDDNERQGLPPSIRTVRVSTQSNDNCTIRRVNGVRIGPQG